MEIHILLFDDRVERASVDALKICDLADAMNGGPDIVGPYSVVSVDLEDASLTPVETDAQKPCRFCKANRSFNHFYCANCGRNLRTV